MIIVTESTANATYVPHRVTDHVFDTLMGENEIITVDNIKYEKVQYTDTVNIKNTMREIFPHYWGLWGVQLCGQVDGHESPCFHVFQVSTPLVSYTEGDIVISHWTVLRGIA